MKKASMNARKECTNAYQECENRENCSCICRGPERHPECKSYRYCGIDRRRCDGRCNVHTLQKKYEEKEVLKNSLSQALTEINFAYRTTDEEMTRLKKRMEELMKEYK